MSESIEYKKKIPELKRIRRCLKEKCYDYKQSLNNIKSRILV